MQPRFHMNVSSNCVTVIEKHEGFRSHPYLDQKGVPTIGFGSTYYENGTKVTMADSPITMDQATQLMMHKLNSEFVPGVQKAVTVPLTQNQFDSLVDFAYNAGVGHLTTSTLLKKLNSGDYAGAADEFMKWTFAGGVENAGLKSRRIDERTLFLKLDDKVAEITKVVEQVVPTPVAEPVITPVVIPIQQPSQVTNAGIVSSVIGWLASLFGKKS